MMMTQSIQHLSVNFWHAAEVILQTINEIGNWYPSTDDKQERGKLSFAANHYAAVINAMTRRFPIRLILPGFPAKSANREKTLGQEPDLGELLALTRLNELCRSIAELYSPGAEIIICSDGRIFSDVVGISDLDVDLYRAGILKLIDKNQLNHLKLFCLEDQYSTQSYEAMRQAVMSEYSEDLTTLRQRVKTTATEQVLFNGIHRFIFEDALATKPQSTSRNQLRTSVKLQSYEVIRRSNAWSRLIRDRYPDALRLSIHPQPVGSEKFGVTLLPGNGPWGTPWHGAVLWDGLHHTLHKAEAARRLGAKLSLSEEGLAYLTLPHVNPPKTMISATLRSKP